MQNEKIKNKIYLNVLLVLIIGAICYFFIYPQYSGQGTFYSPEKNISTLLKNKKDYDNALSIAADYNTKIVKANTEYNNATQKLPISTLNKILPSSIDSVIIIYKLTQIAALPGSNMLLTDPRFADDGANAGGPSDPNKKYNTLSVDFSMQGTYDSMKFFLKNLENSDRVFNVTKLDFSSDPSAKSTSILKYSMTVETYYLKQK